MNDKIIEDWYGRRGARKTTPAPRRKADDETSPTRSAAQTSNASRQGSSGNSVKAGQLFGTNHSDPPATPPARQPVIVPPAQRPPATGPLFHQQQNQNDLFGSSDIDPVKILADIYFQGQKSGPTPHYPISHPGDGHIEFLPRRLPDTGHIENLPYYSPRGHSVPVQYANTRSNDPTPAPGPAPQPDPVRSNTQPQYAFSDPGILAAQQAQAKHDKEVQEQIKTIAIASALGLPISQSQSEQPSNSLDKSPGSYSMYGWTEWDVPHADSELTVPILSGQEAGYNGDSGLDIYAPVGTDCVAAASGTIVYSEHGHTKWNKEPDTPNSVLIKLDHPITYNGKTAYYIWYTHLSDLKYTVHEGDGQSIHINAGDIVGKTGLGRSVPHLHFGIIIDRNQSDKNDYFSVDEIRGILGLDQGQKVGSK